MSSSRPTSPTRPSRPGMLNPHQPTPAAASSQAPQPLRNTPSSSSSSSATLFPSRPPPLHLTVRFSTSVPDLHLDVPNPDRTTVAALKHLIRPRLPAPHSARRLRFIHGGKILPDDAVLSSILRAPPPPPRSSAARDHNRDRERDKGKGKAVVEGSPAAAAAAAAAADRVYVNCSIGDVLPDADLAAEARAAARPVADPKVAAAATTTGGKDDGGRGSQTKATAATMATTTGSSTRAGGGGGDGTLAARRSTPRGFDRLLTAGFSGAEVNQLRLQFRSIQASRHTPDTMPSPDTLRGMEDAWIDNNNDAGTGTGAGGAAAGGGGGDGGAGDADEGFGMAGLVDVLVKGMVIGFMFPLGSVGWLIREEGLWSSRWQVFVSFGFILSLTIGLIRAISSG
ncbi:DUF2407 C-terminal domain-containing protein [Phialemonium atrogriseum]|uniref:DUF2407 C-terminal domain-containing protein n=1 Tax=Phialemonium atrogriseum TaxID=1093897 RepID=A0AAJ0FRM1_9PEZI|nr:DUF2407 C-terminal domain-containing protein [Phialemonium atrogriseum]KAK1772423.1 DUF2407 C-terminal domain-containing protein [Phialemonium atrogriseum]